MKKAAFVLERPSLWLALASLALHAFANAHYGFFRDELYFIVCGERPAWGYVDQPPVVPLLAAWWHGVFGDFVWGFRLLPTLALTAAVALTVEFTRAIGGGRYAQWLAGLCALFAPIFLIQGVLFFTDMFQPLSWLALVWIAVKVEQTRDQRWWLAFGAVAGASLETKYLVAFFLGALALGLLATPLRRSLIRPWVYFGLLIAAAIVLPNLLWQQAHNWPFLELGAAGANGKNLAMSPLAYLAQQFLQVGPLAMIVALCGLWAGAVRPGVIVARAVAIAWVILFVLFDGLHGKPYYLMSIYPALFAFGAARIEHWLANTAARAAALAGVVILGALVAPLTLPILPVGIFVRYERMLGFTPSVGERGETGVLPQYYADMFGWPEMAAKVARVYWSLPPDQRESAVFYGNNYGEAAAIDVFGRRLGLPPAISGHNNYYLWGPRGHDGSVLIIIGGDTKHFAALFHGWRIAGRINTPYAMPYETGKPIYVLTGMKIPLAKFWPKVKHYE